MERHFGHGPGQLFLRKLGPASRGRSVLKKKKEKIVFANSEKGSLPGFRRQMRLENNSEASPRIKERKQPGVAGALLELHGIARC
jgi:hypothetical protein